MGSRLASAQNVAVILIAVAACGTFPQAALCNLALAWICLHPNVL